MSNLDLTLFAKQSKSLKDWSRHVQSRYGFWPATQNLVDDVDAAMTEIQFLFTRIKLILWRNRSQQGRVICHWVKQCWIRWRRFVLCGVNLSFSFCQFSLPASSTPLPISHQSTLLSNPIYTFLDSLFHFLCSHLLIQTVRKRIRDLVKFWILICGQMCYDVEI